MLDSDLTVTWNSSLETTSTVTIKLYQNGALLGTIGSGLPNSGSATFSRISIINQFIPGGFTNNEGNCYIELISDANPAIRDVTPYFYFMLND